MGRVPYNKTRTTPGLCLRIGLVFAMVERLIVPCHTLKAATSILYNIPCSLLLGNFQAVFFTLFPAAFPPCDTQSQVRTGYSTLKRTNGGARLT